MKKLLTFSLMAASLQGCVTPYETYESNSIRPANLNQVADCLYLGPVNSFAGAIYGGTQGAMNVARNKVSALGGNTIVVTNTTSSRNGRGEVIADAYNCN